MPQQPIDLPPGLDALWGRRPPATRGPKPGLDAKQIVAAALDLASAEGLQAVSMARVAKAVGFTTMSLYRHVTNKDELLQRMYDATMRELSHFELEGEDWRSRLRSWSIIQRRVLQQNIWIVEMPMATPPATPNSLAWLERGMAAMVDTAIAATDKIRILGLISQHVLISSRMAYDEQRLSAQAGRSTYSYEKLLQALVNAEDFPHLYRLAWDGDDDAAPPEATATPEEAEAAEFGFGLEVLLDGIETLINNAATSQA